MDGGNVWALVLAAGSGTRLRSLTTTAGGLQVPKQFCSLRGGSSLLADALARADAVSGRAHQVTVVADQHRRWWERSLRTSHPGNIVVQPENRGTAAGLLLPLMHILQRDPAATVLVLPSDHFFLDEALLARELRRGCRLAGADRESVYMLGLHPSEPDPELGYIVPERGVRGGASGVRRFVEKPPVAVASELIGAGALLNMFILVASAQALLGLYAAREPALVAQLRDAVRADRLIPQDPQATRLLYARLPTLDFSRDILEGQESRLRVLAVPACGWSDLGTPGRVLDTLARLGTRLHTEDAADGEPRGSDLLNLAEQHHRRPAIPSLHAFA